MRLKASRGLRASTRHARNWAFTPILAKKRPSGLYTTDELLLANNDFLRLANGGKLLLVSKS